MYQIIFIGINWRRALYYEHSAQPLWFPEHALQTCNVLSDYIFKQGSKITHVCFCFVSRNYSMRFIVPNHYITRVVGMINRWETGQATWQTWRLSESERERKPRILTGNKGVWDSSYLSVCLLFDLPRYKQNPYLPTYALRIARKWIDTTRNVLFFGLLQSKITPKWGMINFRHELPALGAAIFNSWYQVV
jgi:hypothetical protein